MQGSVRVSVLTGAIIMLLAGCSGPATPTTGIGPGGQGVAPLIRIAGGQFAPIPLSLQTRWRGDSHPRWMTFSPDANAPTGNLYVSEFGGGYPPILKYKQNNRKNRKARCMIAGTNAVNGIGTDSAGDLFVPWALGSVGTINEYAPDCGALLRTMDDPEGQPDDVAVDGDTAYVSQIFGSPNIEIYANDATVPTGSLSDPSINEGIGIAVDSSHNVFLANVNASGEAAVIEFPGGAMPGSVLATGFPAFDSPGGLLFDSSNNLLLLDLSVPDIQVFAPPYNAPAVATIPLRGSGLHCAFAGKGKHRLYCADYTYTSIDAYKYPSGAYLYSYTTGLSPSNTTTGVAFYATSR